MRRICKTWHPEGPPAALALKRLSDGRLHPRLPPPAGWRGRLPAAYSTCTPQGGQSAGRRPSHLVVVLPTGAGLGRRLPIAQSNTLFQSSKLRSSSKAFHMYRGSAPSPKKLAWPIFCMMYMPPAFARIVAYLCLPIACSSTFTSRTLGSRFNTSLTGPVKPFQWRRCRGLLVRPCDDYHRDGVHLELIHHVAKVGFALE